MREPVLWGLHAGHSGDADTLFSTTSVVAIGWAEMGDLRTLGAHLSDFNKCFARAFPKKPETTQSICAGELYDFVHEAKVGDLVAYSCKAERRIWLGRIRRQYTFEPDPLRAYAHHRSVRWLSRSPRKDFSKGALKQIDRPRSFFKIDKDSEDFHAAAARA